MLKQVLFQIHWALGITAGMVLAVIGLSGALMSFEDEIMNGLSHKVSTVAVRDQPRLTVPQLTQRFFETHPHAKLEYLIIEGDPRRAPQVIYSTTERSERTFAVQGQSYIDPYDGHLLGGMAGRIFFSKVRQLHRWLFLPGHSSTRHDVGWGRLATQVTAMSMIFFALSGLYMRWPKRPLDWRSWFKLDLHMTGRNLYRSLHAVIGGWLLLIYLLSAITGLWWSFGDQDSWYRDAISQLFTGHNFVDDGDGGFGLPHDLSKAWAGFKSVYPQDFAEVTIQTRAVGDPIRFRVLPVGSPTGADSRSWDVVKVDDITGQVVLNTRYGDDRLGERIVSGIEAIHMGGFFGLPGRIVLTTAALTVPLFSVTGLLLYLGRRRKKRELRATEAEEPLPVGDGSLIVVYATQTRTAERLARKTAAAFASVRPVDLVSIDKLTAQMLAQAKTALFVVSTYGEGEPPDSARGFVRRLLATRLPLSGLDYAVLALGDREYQNFCAFGHRVDEWLQAAGAHRLFETVEVNGEDGAALAGWRQGIAALGAAADSIKLDAAVYQRWKLIERKVLNPGSPGQPAFHVSLQPVEAMASWEAGDIAVILPGRAPAVSAAAESTQRRRDGRDAQLVAGAQGIAMLKLLPSMQVAMETAGASAQWNAPIDSGRLPPRAAETLAPAQASPAAQPYREYSIASIPAMQRIEFLVRQVQKGGGEFGLGSGWLTQHAAIGDEIHLRVRPNAAFRAADDSRAVILIGNGTGLAGLLAHVRQRSKRKAAPMWLLFGERSREHDRFHAEELEQYVAAGTLTRVDCAFSRDAGDGRYVQDLILEFRDHICRWVDKGAAIYVCGSLQGMAPAVDQRLREVLGTERVDELADTGRYRRDVY